GLEHRVNGALGTLADDAHLTLDHMSDREQERQQDALHFLGDIERLAQAAADVSTGSNGIPVSVAQNWAGGKMGEFDAKRTDLVGALASQAASGKDIDSATLGRLDQAKMLVAGLHDAVAVQSALDQMQPLSRWVDWTIATADVQTVLGPVRDASTAAVTGFINDDDDAMRNWPAIREQYAPLMNLIASAGEYVDQCNALPGDLIGEMAKLATPMDDAPFAEERFASLCMGLWSAYNQAQPPDQHNADAMVQALMTMGR
ncbi:MAG TPA: hypothetical protein VHY37_12285, partial [Tepidisphaeraceae bacterium]|nr:hypothetical protein [Tepidisphaeraceae bacterium]